MLITGVSPSFSTTSDSLRTEQINGKHFIVHQVDKGETLYAISRRYKVSVSSIISHNQHVESGLKIGILIKIPLVGAVEKIDTTAMISHQVKIKETLFSIARRYETSVVEIKSWNNLVSNELNIGQILYLRPPKIVADISGKLTHVLQQGETLYSLSGKYDIGIEQLRLWNNLQQDSSLRIGKLLIVGEKPAEKSTGKNIAQIEKIPVDTALTSNRAVNVNGFEKVVESGIGELIPGPTETRKYLGLHRTAKAGTIMKVHNEMNNKIVFVRIIGRIPDTGDNEKVLLKISKAAYDRLGVIDQRFRIEISYMP